MFRRTEGSAASGAQQVDRVDSVLGAGIAWRGNITGTGGVRIDGAYDGDIAVRGLVVIGQQGRVTSESIRAMTLIVAGSVKGNILAQRVEIAKSGRVWGDVVTASFSTEEGAFLRGKITMEEQIDLGLGDVPEWDEAPVPDEEAG